MSYYFWKPYVSAAERRKRAQRKIAELKKKGQVVEPVIIEGRQITRTFWGNAWCTNLERYSDFENRLERGRTYARNGSILDLQINAGRVTALVHGSALYKVDVRIKPVAATKWKALCRSCSGSIDSLVELLQGQLSLAVMDRMCKQGEGLFPAGKDVTLKCSCPDWAVVCKHVAAVLYGIGARLDTKPELLFVLRDVDVNELIANAGKDLQLGQAKQGGNHLVGEDLGELFGLDIGEAAEPLPKTSNRSQTSRRQKKAGSPRPRISKTPEKPAKLRRAGVVMATTATPKKAKVKTKVKPQTKVAARIVRTESIKTPKTTARAKKKTAPVAKKSKRRST